MKTYTILGMILSLVLLNGAFAQNSNISLNVSPEELYVDPYEIAVYDILIENEGITQETYTISVKGIPEDWYFLSHEAISIESSETKKVYLFITPQPTEQNSYVGMVIINNVSVEFNLNIVKEHEIQVSIPSQISSCLCEEDQIMIVVKNTGKYSENIDLVLSGDAVDIVNVEIESFTLEANETKQIPVNIDSACDTQEKIYILNVDVKSTNSYASTSSLSNIQKIKCFSFEMDYPKEVRTCANVEETFQITIVNTGIKKDSYEVSIEELGYSDIIDLDSGQTQQFKVTFVREEKGVYKISFNISSDTDQQEGLVEFIVEKCFGVDLELDVDEITIKSGTGKLTKPSVKNVGVRPNTFDVEASATWVAVRPGRLTLSPNESQNIFVYYSPEYGSSGEYDVQLTAKAENAVDEEIIRVNVVEENVITTTQEIPTTILGENVTETNMTTITEEFPELPEVNITKPTGMFGKIWEKLESFSLNITQRVEELGLNKMVLSLVVGFVIALIILVIVYFIVMRD